MAVTIMPLPTDINIWLGSQSPRRSEILKAAGYSFQTIVSDKEETTPPHISVTKIPEYLAIQKNNDILPLLADENALLITADTLVILEDTVLGKPKDRDDAIKILSLLSGNTHTVITGVCIADKRGNISTFSSATSVTFRELDVEEILFFIDNYKPYDKAGAYAVQEWIGYVGISHIEGCYYNIMGLPMHDLYLRLKNWSH